MSIERAVRADTPRAASMATVMTVVITGKCQNSHTMVAADSANIAKNAAVLLYPCDDLVMPSPRNDSPCNALYTASLTKRPYSKDP